MCCRASLWGFDSLLHHGSRNVPNKLKYIQSVIIIIVIVILLTITCQLHMFGSHGLLSTLLNNS